MRRTALLGTVIALAATSGTAQAAPAQLDPSFGGGAGYTTIPNGFRFTSVDLAPGGSFRGDRR